MAKHPLQHIFPDLGGNEIVRDSAEKKNISPDFVSEAIEAYLARMKRIVSWERNGHFKDALIHTFVSPSDEALEEKIYFEKKIAREQGHGDVEISEEIRMEMYRNLTAVQEDSFQPWLDYLMSGDTAYLESWQKYYALRGLLKLGKYDKEKQKFSERTKKTIAPFPELNREALGMVLGRVKDYYEHNKRDADPAWNALLQGANFGKLYSRAMQDIVANAPTKEEKEILEGSWRIYEQGENGDDLKRSLQGFNTGWCTAEGDTASVQLKGGDFHLFYSKNKEGAEVVPRIAIRMENGSIREVRGVAPQQEVEPEMVEITEKQMVLLPGHKAYETKTADMKLLTCIEKKQLNGEVCTEQELRFLYELDRPIVGFGYKKDPRIAEIRSKRKPAQDMLIIFDCTEAEIAHTWEDITKNTKAYVGPLQENFFDALPDSLEHIYTSFPEGRIRFSSLEIGGKTAEELEKALDEGKMNVDTYARTMLKNKKQFVEPVNERYTKLKGTVEKLDLVRLSVADLGFASGATTKEIFERANMYGLELCPPETGPYQRLEDRDQPLNDWYRIGMEPVTDSDGDPLVFYCERDDDGLWLGCSWAGPGGRWIPDFTFLFRRRKSNT